MSLISDASPSTTGQNTTLTFSTRQLYGGAITVVLPQSFIDASDLRQVPDHQEVFLSSDTLTSIIFEINDLIFINARDLSDPARFHFTDVITRPDHLAVSSADDLTLTEVRLSQESTGKFPACVVQGEIISPPSARSDSTRATRTKCLQLLIRIREYTTDICVRINVPDTELIMNKDRLSQEEMNARQIMETVVRTFDIKDFGLFGTG